MAPATTYSPMQTPISFFNASALPRCSFCLPNAPCCCAATADLTNRVKWVKSIDHHRLVWKTDVRPVSTTADEDAVLSVVAQVKVQDCWPDPAMLWRRQPIMQNCSAAAHIHLRCITAPPVDSHWNELFWHSMSNLNNLALHLDTGHPAVFSCDDTMSFRYVPASVRHLTCALTSRF